MVEPPTILPTTLSISTTDLDDTQMYIIATRNPDRSWAVVFMNNIGEDKDVVLQFGKGNSSWRGVIPNATVVTWVLPAGERWHVQKD
jgi:glucosylceramidase